MLLPYLLVALGALSLFIGCSPKVEKKPPVIAIMSDLGTQDAALGYLRGLLTSSQPTTRLWEISHDIIPGDLLQAAYLIDAVGRDLPAESLIIALVQAETSKLSPAPLLIRTKSNKFYLGPDNGLFQWVIRREGLAQAWLVDPLTAAATEARPKIMGGLLHDAYYRATAALKDGALPSFLSLPKGKLVALPILEPKVSGRNINCTIIGIDRRGNLITNIPLGISEVLQEGKAYRVTLGGRGGPVMAPLLGAVTDIPEGRTLLIYNAEGWLTLAIHKGSAAQQYKITRGETLLIQP
jgi:S-adenosyl-L-methionine hydrolase (adenosine-forming)